MFRHPKSHPIQIANTLVMKKCRCRFIFLLFLAAATSEKIHQTISEVFDRSDVFKPNKNDPSGNWEVVPIEKKNDPLTTSLPKYVEVEQYGKDYVGMDGNY